MSEDLPPGLATALTERLLRDYGHVVRVEVNAAVEDDGMWVNTYVDGELTGGFEFWWDPGSSIDQVLDDLLDRVTELNAQELGSGD